MIVWAGGGNPVRADYSPGGLKRAKPIVRGAGVRSRRKEEAPHQKHTQQKTKEKSSTYYRFPAPPRTNPYGTRNNTARQK